MGHNPQRVHKRFAAWVEWTRSQQFKVTGKRPSLKAVGDVLGVTQPCVTQLMTGARWAGHGLSISIERATAGWHRGPIVNGEWLVRPAENRRSKREVAA